jgi:uncharacterized protein YutE (UPF0331/DUF86 family)
MDKVKNIVYDYMNEYRPMETERKTRYYEKIQHLIKYLNLLNGWSDLIEKQKKGTKKDPKSLFAIYHAFQLSMEVLSDVASMTTKDLTKIVKDDYSNFQILFDEKIISDPIFNDIKNLNGLRNRIVHDYDGLDDNILLVGISESLKNIPKFKDCVEIWLKKQ